MVPDRADGSPIPILNIQLFQMDRGNNMKVYLMTPKYSIEAETTPTWRLLGIVYENNHKIFILDVAFLFFFRVSLMVRKYLARKKGAR